MSAFVFAFSLQLLKQFLYLKGGWCEFQPQLLELDKCGRWVSSFLVRNKPKSKETPPQCDAFGRFAETRVTREVLWKFLSGRRRYDWVINNVKKRRSRCRSKHFGDKKGKTKSGSWEKRCWRGGGNEQIVSVLLWCARLDSFTGSQQHQKRTFPGAFLCRVIAAEREVWWKWNRSSLWGEGRKKEERELRAKQARRQKRMVPFNERLQPAADRWEY